MLKVNNIYNMDVRDGISKLDKKSIDMTVTSPPYYGLRNYGDDTVSIWDGNKNCKHDWEIKKTARPNQAGGIGDKSISGKGGTQPHGVDYHDRVSYSSFCSKCGAWKGQLGLEPSPDLYIKHLCDIYDNIKKVLKNEGTCWVNIGDSYTSNKSLSCMPFRFAIEMTNRGWILRNTIIWHKRNCMPSSIKDRFTVDFEYLFFFSKNKKYYFEQQFEPYQMDGVDKYKKQIYKGKAIKDYESAGVQNASDVKRRCLESMKDGKGRNKRTTWAINTKPFPKAHFAVYPEELIETPIKAGCPEDGIVFDPFIGAGTTAVVAKKLNRDFIGFEINEEYVEIAKERLEGK